MTPSRRTRLTILAGLAGSIAAHAALLGTAWSPGSAPVTLEPVPPPDLVVPPEDEIALGLDVAARETITWVGFATYQEHKARLSETEQAAFTSTPSGMQEMPSAASPPRPAPPAPQSEPQTAAAPPEVVAIAPQESATAAPPAPQEKPPDAERPPAPAPTPAPPSPPAGAPGDPGEVAEQESDATSDVPWDKIANGRPLAARGLVLKPRKPVLTYWIRFSSAPVDPIVTIQFGRDGVPAKASVDRSSGDDRVDEAILNSLYRWRAAGEKLAEMPEGDTCTVTLRIVMSGRS